MKINTAIEILAEIHEAADGLRGDALALAIAMLEDAHDRLETEVDEAERMLRAVLDGAEGRDRTTTWRFLRGKLTLPRDVIDEVERRLGLAGEGSTR